MLQIAPSTLQQSILRNIKKLKKRSIYNHDLKGNFTNNDKRALQKD